MRAQVCQSASARKLRRFQDDGLQHARAVVGAAARFHSHCAVLVAMHCEWKIIDGDTSGLEYRRRGRARG
jgi:hypothetical protein